MPIGWNMALPVPPAEGAEQASELCGVESPRDAHCRYFYRALRVAPEEQFEFVARLGR